MLNREVKEKNVAELTYMAMRSELKLVNKKLYGWANKTVRKCSDSYCADFKAYERTCIFLFRTVCSLLKDTELSYSVKSIGLIIGGIEESGHRIIELFLIMHNYFVRNKSNTELLKEFLWSVDVEFKNNVESIRHLCNELLCTADFILQNFTYAAACVSAILFFCDQMSRRFNTNASYKFGMLVSNAFCLDTSISLRGNGIVNMNYNVNEPKLYLENCLVMLKEFCVSASQLQRHFLTKVMKKKYHCSYQDILFALYSASLNNPNAEPFVVGTRVLLVDGELKVVNGLPLKNRHELSLPSSTKFYSGTFLPFSVMPEELVNYNIRKEVYNAGASNSSSSVGSKFLSIEEILGLNGKNCNFSASTSSVHSQLNEPMDLTVIGSRDGFTEVNCTRSSSSTIVDQQLSDDIIDLEGTDCSEDIQAENSSVNVTQQQVSSYVDLTESASSFDKTRYAVAGPSNSYVQLNQVGCYFAGPVINAALPQQQLSQLNSKVLPWQQGMMSMSQSLDHFVDHSSSVQCQNMPNEVPAVLPKVSQSNETDKTASNVDSADDDIQCLQPSFIIEERIGPVEDDDTSPSSNVIGQQLYSYVNKSSSFVDGKSL